MTIPTVVITPSTPNFSNMPFERDDKLPGTERSEKLHGLGLELGGSPSQSLLARGSRRQQRKYRALAISLTFIALFALIIVGPAVPLRRLLSDSVSRDVDALKTFVGMPSALHDDDTPIEAPYELVKRQNELRPYRPAFGPGQGRRSAVIDLAKREEVLQRRETAAWHFSVIDEAIAHKLADLEGPGGVSAAAVYISQEHYDEDKALESGSAEEVPRSFQGAVSEEAVVPEGEDDDAPVVEQINEEEELESVQPQRFNLPAESKAPWSLDNEINAKQKEAGRLAAS